MFETAPSLTGLTGAVLAVWVVLIVALFLVTRGLSRSLAWAFVAAGLVIPAAALQFWPLGASAACVDTVLSDGESADSRYAWRIVQNHCRGSSELAYRVEMGRKVAGTTDVALRPVMRSYGFPRPIAVRQVIDNHFLIFLTSNGRDQVPLRISLDPRTGEPSYVHRFFQGHSDRSFTVSGLSETAAVSTGRGAGVARHGGEKRPERDKSPPGKLNAVAAETPPEQNGAEKSRTLKFHLRLRALLPGG